MNRISPQRSVVAFVLLTYGITWGLVIPAGVLTSSRTVQFAAVTLGAFGPLIAALILTWRSGVAVGDWVRATLRWRVSARWYLAALGLPLSAVAAQAVVYAALGGSVDLSLLPRRALLWLGLLPVPLLLTGGNEEFGWRGFLLPQLQRSYGALAASLIIGVVWLVWHLPGDLLLTTLGGGLSWSAGRIANRLATIPLAVILTWLYDNTRGSVPVAMIFHASWNSMGILLPAPIPTEGLGAVGLPSTPVIEVVRVAVMTGIAIPIGWRLMASTANPGRGLSASR